MEELQELLQREDLSREEEVQVPSLEEVLLLVEVPSLPTLGVVGVVVHHPLLGEEEHRRHHSLMIQDIRTEEIRLTGQELEQGQCSYITIFYTVIAIDEKF